jgi:hypothetical protein
LSSAIDIFTNLEPLQWKPYPKLLFSSSSLYASSVQCKTILQLSIEKPTVLCDLSVNYYIFELSESVHWCCYWRRPVYIKAPFEFLYCEYILLRFFKRWEQTETLSSVKLTHVLTSFWNSGHGYWNLDFGIYDRCKI